MVSDEYYLLKEDEGQIFQEWQEQKHITTFAVQLHKEHMELTKNGIVVKEEDVVKYCILQMCQGDNFDWQDMTTYNNKLDNKKSQPWIISKSWLQIERHTNKILVALTKRAQYKSTAGIEEVDESMANDIRQYIESLERSKEEEHVDKEKLQFNNEQILSIQNNLHG